MHAIATLLTGVLYDQSELTRRFWLAMGVIESIYWTSLFQDLHSEEQDVTQLEYRTLETHCELRTYILICYNITWSLNRTEFECDVYVLSG